MRPIAFAAGILCAIAGSASTASSVTYQYQGLPFGYGTPWQGCPATWHSYPVPDPCPSKPWTGSLTIDESMYPGRSIAGSTLILTIFDAQYEDLSPCEYEYEGQCYQYVVKSKNGTVRQGYTSLGWGEFDFFHHDGHVDEFIGFTVVEGSFTWKFDDDANVAFWSGGNYCGGDCDPFTQGGANVWSGDSYFSGSRTLGPGQWTRVPPVAEIPVPATALTLASGLGLTAAAALWRKKQRS